MKVLPLATRVLAREPVSYQFCSGASGGKSTDFENILALVLRPWR